MQIILKLKDREIQAELDGDELETDDPLNENSKKCFIEETNDTFYVSNVEELLEQYKD